MAGYPRHELNHTHTHTHTRSLANEVNDKFCLPECLLSGCLSMFVRKQQQNIFTYFQIPPAERIYMLVYVLQSG